MVTTLASGTICSLCGGCLRSLELTWETCYAECFCAFFILVSFISNFKMNYTNKMTIYMSTYLTFQASEKLAHAKKWVETHIEATKMKWISVKEKLVVLKNVEPYVQKVSTRC
uniref:Uncharacterized protein n=1 Tax=Zea mays TaxID=4577 RepID=A0A804R3Q2_MAIZE